MWIGHVYSTQQIADMLDIGRSTVNKYARNLEDMGYEFKKADNEWRAFTEHDLIMFRALVELLARGVRYDSAILSIVERYKTNPNSHHMPVAATLDSSNFIKMEEHLDAVMFAIQSLSKRIDETIDARVKSEVAAATAQLSTQVDNVAEQIRITKESTDEKLNILLSRTETHGRCLPWWKFWK
jgi:biotin operon repressor